MRKGMQNSSQHRIDQKPKPKNSQKPREFETPRWGNKPKNNLKIYSLKLSKITSGRVNQHMWALYRPDPGPRGKRAKKRQVNLDLIYFWPTSVSNIYIYCFQPFKKHLLLLFSLKKTKKRTGLVRSCLFNRDSKMVVMGTNENELNENGVILEVLLLMKGCNWLLG